MKICYYYARGRSEDSGVTAAMSSWASALQTAGQVVEVMTAGGPVSEAYYDVRVRTLPHVGRSRRTLLPRSRPFLEALEGCDLLVLHEGWTVSHLAAAVLAKRRSVPYVVMPHGVYEPQLVQHLRLPRARALVERRFLESAAAVHLFFDSERANLRNLGVSTAAVVCPTGSEPPSTSEVRLNPEGPLLWFGRMDVRHKGLDLLIEGLAQVPVERRRSLRIAGYDFAGGLATLTALVAEQELHDWVTIEGPISGEAKRAALASAYAYVHPSRWESYGIALVEALASGVPVMVGDGAHIASLLESTCAATVVPGTSSGWAQALSSFEPDPGQAEGRRQLFERLDWKRVTSECIEAYQALG